MARSLQDKIKGSYLNALKKTYDAKVKVSGTSMEMLYVNANSVDWYGDNQTLDLADELETVEIVIDLPNDIPIQRFISGDPNNRQITQTNTYLFDILPIEAYPKFSQKVNKDDFFIYKFNDDNNNNMYLLLQVTDTVGSFRKDMLGQKCYLALYNGPLATGLVDYIESIT